MTTSEKVKLEMKRQGITVYGISRRAKVNYNTVRVWSPKIDIDVIDKIVEALGCELQIVPLEAEKQNLAAGKQR
jgi:hypothetical protein